VVVLPIGCGKSYNALSYLDGKDALTNRLAEKYGADEKFTKALLYVIHSKKRLPLLAQKHGSNAIFSHDI